MTDTLIRVSLSGTSDFHPLALAPGLPMLDGKKLTYQVLLGWFGNLLAEPFLDEDGVVFRIQHGGRPLQIVERSIATDSDLDGVLAGDFDRLKKALFDVRPVSPSERLIFNRLNPPIANHDGMLYRVKTENGPDRLVWCWGFQRRAVDGKARVCSNDECAALFVHHKGQPEICPRCGASFAKIAGRTKKRLRRTPVGAIAATIALTALGLGSYWYAANVSEDGDSEESLLTQLGVEGLRAAEEQPKPKDTQTAVAEGANAVISEEDTPPLKRVDTTALPVLDPTKPEDQEELNSARPRPLFEPDMPELRAPVIGKTPDLPRLDDPAHLEIKPIPKPEEPSDQKTEKAPKPELTPDDDQKPLLPELVNLPEPDPVKTQLPKNSDATKSTVTPDSNPLPIQLNPIVEKLEEPTQSPASPTAQPGTKRLAGLSWHQDYLAAYQQAIDQQRPLLMVLRDTLEPEGTDAGTSAFSATELEPLLGNYVRVSMSIGATVPGLSAAEAPTRLLEHRSFRHLNGRPGLAIIDLTDAKGPYFGRVVTAVPLPENGRFSAELLKRALQLPPGSIGQRTLVLTIRVSLPDSSFANGDPHPQLMQLASRSARLMAQNEQPGSFDQGARIAAVVNTFGNSARMRELVFATPGPTTVQDAAIQAVRQWLQSTDDLAVLNQSATAYGVDLYQSPSSQRWYASCVIVNRPN